MAKFKYGNHDDVLNFGKKSLYDNIDNLLIKCNYGSVTTIRNITDGINIISRLGSKKDRQDALNLIVKNLETFKSLAKSEWENNQLFIVQEHMTSLENDNGY